MDQDDHNFENIFNSIKATAGTICFPVHHYHSTSRRFTGEGKGGGRIMIISTQKISADSIPAQAEVHIETKREQWYRTNGIEGTKVKLDIKTFKIEDFDKYIVSLSNGGSGEASSGLKSANNTKAHSITLTKDSKIEYKSVNKQLSIVFHNIIKNNKKFVERDTFHLISDLRNDKAGTTLNNFFTITQLTQLAQMVETVCSSFIPETHPIESREDSSSQQLFNRTQSKGLGYAENNIILEEWQKIITMNEYIGIINGFFPNMNKTKSSQKISGGSEKPKVDWTDVVTREVDKAHADKRESSSSSDEPLITNVESVLDHHKNDIKLGVDKYSSKFIYNNYFSVITHLYFYWLEYLNIAAVSGGIKETPGWKKVSYGILSIALIGLAVTGVGLIGEVALGGTLITSVISTGTEILGVGIESGAEVVTEGVGEVVTEGVVDSATEVGSEELSNVQLSELTDVINESSDLTESDKQLLLEAQTIETNMDNEGITEGEKKIIQTAQMLVIKKGINKSKSKIVKSKKGGRKKRTKKLKRNKQLRTNKLKRNRTNKLKRHRTNK